MRGMRRRGLHAHLERDAALLALRGAVVAEGDVSAAVLELGAALCGLFLGRAEPTTDAEAVRLCGVAHTIAVVAVRETRSPAEAARAAALLGALCWHETRCHDDALGDRGRSCTAWQLHRGARACVALLADREYAAGEALGVARRSLGACRRGPELHVLAAYASGRCSAGHRESARFVRTWNRWTPILLAAVVEVRS